MHKPITVSAEDRKLIVYMFDNHILPSLQLFILNKFKKMNLTHTRVRAEMFRLLRVYLPSLTKDLMIRNVETVTFDHNTGELYYASFESFEYSHRQIIYTLNDAYLNCAFDGSKIVNGESKIEKLINGVTNFNIVYR